MSVGWYFLLAAAGLDLLLPFLLAPFYPGYSHRRQVMSVLGSPESPARWVYRVWLVALGLLLCAATPDLWAAFGNRSPVLTGLLIAVLCVFALGAGVLAGLFSVNADKAVETAASRIHGVGSVLGFLALAFAPLLAALLAFGRVPAGPGYSPWSALPSMCAVSPSLLWRTRRRGVAPGWPRRAHGSGLRCSSCICRWPFWRPHSSFRNRQIS